MRIGYACLTVGVPNTGLHTCRQKNASENRLGQLIDNNLTSLENIIDYNVASGIRLFRISSDLIPFGSSPVNTIPWWERFAPRLARIGSKIRDSGMRVSMHPGQYTVLNSPRKEVTGRALDDLEYHARVLDNLGTGPESKIVLHVGGVYNDRKRAVRRFMETYANLDERVRRRLVIENDERSYSIGEVLEIGHLIGIPVIYDNLHHRVNPGPDGAGQGDYIWIKSCAATWQPADGPQKIHYSQQDPGKQPGAHSASIRVKEFFDFSQGLEDRNIDIMLEVKDKNLSAVKCANAVASGKNRIAALEQEWSRYKYTVLEKSPQLYQQVRELLKEKQAYPALEFYGLLENALNTHQSVGHAVNALEHVWGYFRQGASNAERERFLALIADFRQERLALSNVKKYLQRLAEKYQEEYLLNSYYFIL